VGPSFILLLIQVYHLLLTFQGSHAVNHKLFCFTYYVSLAEWTDIFTLLASKSK